MAKAAPVQTPVSTRALLQRINRRLSQDLEGVKKARTERALQELGEYYLVDFSRNFVIDKDVDLETLGREIGALAPYERVDGGD